MSNDEKEVKCAECGKLFMASSYSLLSDFIMQVKPVCSRECRVALSGERAYICDYCGVYKASKPRCNKCEEEIL